jgi:colicin import membrane protein
MIAPLTSLRRLPALVTSALLAAALAACAGKPAHVEPAPPPATHTAAEARDKLDAVVKQRAAVQATYARAEQLCYAKFFVTDCLDDAKDRRRLELVRLRAIEVEAELFQRRAKLAEREKAVAEAEQAAQVEEARRLAEPRVASPEAQREEQRKPEPATAQRKADNAARVKQLEAQEQADRPRRAANNAATAKRRAESEQRQREIAEKLRRKREQEQDKLAPH